MFNISHCLQTAASPRASCLNKISLLGLVATRVVYWRPGGGLMASRGNLMETRPSIIVIFNAKVLH